MPAPLPKENHEEHNDIYCGLPSTFLLDKFVFKRHSQVEIRPLMKLRVNWTHSTMKLTTLQFIPYDNMPLYPYKESLSNKKRAV